MTDKLREAAQQALEALDAMGKPQPTLVETMKMQAHAAKKLRAALAQQDAQAVPQPSPTAGMNIAQRILHVGGRNNDAGYVEFGSIQAVEALVRQVIRDLPELVELANLRHNVKVYREVMALTLNAAPTPAQQAPLEGGPPGSGGWKAYAGEAEKERDYWRQRAQTMFEHQRGEVWYWQGDGNDHLESMCNSLPVVIRADALRELLAAPTPPEQKDLSELYAQGWLNGTQAQSLIDWCNEVDRKPPNIAYTSGPVRQLAYAIAAAVWRSYRAGMEASARLCVGRVDESANQQRNAAFRNDPYGQKRAMLDGEVAKWLAAEIRANARATEAAPPWDVATPPAQRVELTDEEIWNSDTIMAINAEAGLPMTTIAKLARAVIEAYERKNGIK